MNWRAGDACDEDTNRPLTYTRVNTHTHTHGQVPMLLCIFESVAGDEALATHTHARTDMHNEGPSICVRACTHTHTHSHTYTQARIYANAQKRTYRHDETPLPFPQHTQALKLWKMPARTPPALF
jgi:hypothetical protein